MEMAEGWRRTSTPSAFLGVVVVVDEGGRRGEGERKTASNSERRRERMRCAWR